MIFIKNKQTNKNPFKTICDIFLLKNECKDDIIIIHIFLKIKYKISRKNCIVCNVCFKNNVNQKSI